MKLTIEKRRKYESYMFIAPGLLLVIAVLGFPLIYNIVLSLKNMNMRTAKGGSVFIGFANYVEMLKDPKFRLIFGNTVVFTVVCIFFQFTLGMLLALFFSKKSTIGSSIRGLCMIPYLMPMSVTGLLWNNIFSTSSGFVNDLLLKFKIISAAIPWLTVPRLAMTSIIIANCWVGIPFNMLLLTNALANVPTDIYESAEVDGATKFQRFFRITIPIIKPAILSVLIMGCIYTFKCFDLMYIMTSGGPQNATDVLGTYAYQLSFTQFEFSKGSACSIVLFIVLFLVGLVYMRMLKTEE